MADNKKNKYPLKSERYKGVYQRENGTWFWRIKKKPAIGTEFLNLQKSSFKSEEEAFRDRNRMLRELEMYPTAGVMDFDDSLYETFTFGELFAEFLETVESKSSKKKYLSLYDAQISDLDNVLIENIESKDIDLLLLRLALSGYKKSYIDSVRKTLKLVFRYAQNMIYLSDNLIADIIRKPYKLRVLSLFSGIGAAEQALKKLGIDYELVGFCEIDKKASEAYCLLHNVDPKMNLKDITQITKETMNSVADFDLMFFGFPCTDISTAGNQKGLYDEDGNLTRSGLFFKALEIALWKQPKFMVAENVAALDNKNMQETFNIILQSLRDAGYHIYEKTLNAEEYGIPQHRKRKFIVLIRDYVRVEYKFPDLVPLENLAQDFFEKEVSEEYYANAKQEAYILNRDNFKPSFNTDVIPCITTGWGTPSYTRQTFIKDGDRIRCLSSEELMALQGFEKEQGTLLRTKFSKNQVGKMVGNSISVPMVQAVLQSLIDGINNKKIHPKKYARISDKHWKEYIKI